jgi:hypothetical protein
MGDVLRNVAPETTDDESYAAYAAAARDNRLYPCDSEFKRLAATR